MAVQIEVCKTINVLIKRISVSLPESIERGKLLKDLIHYAGQSQDSLKYTHKSLLRHLRRKNSAIRLGVFLIMDAFFRKSSFYRELFLDDFQVILERTLEHFAPGKLPPPQSDLKKLKEIVKQKFEKWRAKFAATNTRVDIAYNYLQGAYKERPQPNSDPANSSSRTSNSNEEFIRRVQEKEKASVLRKVKAEIKENEQEIDGVVTQMQSCFEIIITKPEDFMGCVHDAEDNRDVSRTLREHGFAPQTSIVVDLGQLTQPSIQQTTDNLVVIQTLKELYLTGKKRFLPMIDAWATKANKYGDTDLHALIQTFRTKLLGELMKYEEINILPMGDSDEYDSSDFEEVPEADEFSETDLVLSKVESNLKERSKASSSKSTVILKKKGF